MVLMPPLGHFILPGGTPPNPGMVQRQLQVRKRMKLRRL
jgi:hypothetical protein